uniref:Uncharacterized protein n=1 Tax=viral metagenome TaxID=1070528 RepID=A0A6M3IRR7_9ZZZZ
MAEEEIIVEETETEESPDGEVAEQPEGETEETEEERVSELWGKVVPELADHIKDLSPEAREELLLKRLAAQSTGETAAKGTKEAGPSGQQTETPPVLEIPTFDPDGFLKGVESALETGNAEALSDAFRKQIQWNQAVMQVVNGAVQETRNDVQRLRKDVTDVRLPNDFRNAIPKVKGATEADITAARKLLEDGSAGNVSAALALAVFARNNEVESATLKRKPSEAASRKAKGIAASRHSGGNTSMGQPVPRIPMGQDDYKQMLREAEEANRK